MGKLTDHAEKVWTGAAEPRVFGQKPDSEEIAPGVVFISAFANATLLKTAHGPVLIDAGGRTGMANVVFDVARRHEAGPIGTIVYTHGHLDHTTGAALFLAEAETKGWPRPRIVGHRDVAARFDRYRATAGYNSHANSRQFGLSIAWPTDHAYPDLVYDDRLELDFGDVRLELHHARGETDDHTWLWSAERRVLWTGDLFIWAAPNAGNPQKAQRYAADWARALREMAELNAEILIPGHGPLVLGRDRIARALADTAEWLEVLVAETLERMNAGETLEAVIREVRPPERLAGRRYLRPTYDEPEFLVRNIWRLEGGWYDGIPSHLKPASLAEIGAEIATLGGGIGRMVERARALLAKGELALAAHLIDWAAAAAPSDSDVHRARADIYNARARQSGAVITRGIFITAANESAARATSPAAPQKKPGGA
jgi:alkyl sulfatase BDS1-like metallo-beta-lactamase superfamily hydrolase